MNKPLLQKDVFTTGEVAKLCRVAPRTVSKWFDSGRLRGYRIPGSQDRRIPRRNLVLFLKEFGLPLGDLEADPAAIVKCVCIGTDQAITDALNTVIRCETVNNLFAAALVIHAHPIECVVVDQGIGTAAVQQVFAAAKVPPVVLLLNEDADLSAWTGRAGVSAVLRKPLDPATVADVVRGIVS